MRQPNVTIRHGKVDRFTECMEGPVGTERGHGCVTRHAGAFGVAPQTSSQLQRRLVRARLERQTGPHHL
jgi:hypothetical protein